MSRPTKPDLQKTVIDISTADISFEPTHTPTPLAVAPHVLEVATSADSLKREMAKRVSDGSDPFFAKSTPGGPNKLQPWKRDRGCGALTTSFPTTSATLAVDAMMDVSSVETPYERSRNFAAKLDRHTAATFAPLWTQLTPTTSDEPWDAVLLDTTRTATSSCFHNLLHHPVIPLHPLMCDELQWEFDKKQIGVTLRKTVDELRAERRLAAMEKRKAEEMAAVARKAANGGVSVHQDRLRNKNANDAVRINLAIRDPLAVHLAIAEQYEERRRKHELENYERHVAAIPHQVEKKVSDSWRKAEERPRLHVYVVRKARNVECINRLRTFANDSRLRGCLLWIAEETLLVFLAGGDVALRHLDRWITEKMEWHRIGRDVSTAAVGPVQGTDDEALAQYKRRRVDPSLLERTQGTLLLAISLARVGDISFLLPKKTLAEISAARRQTAQEEPVFVRICDTIEAAHDFVSHEMPAGGIIRSLEFAWRAAFYTPL